MILNRGYFTVKELADSMGISRIAVFKQIKLGKIKAVKVGRNYIIYKKDLSTLADKPLNQADKNNIEKGVKKVLNDYGETIKMLGKE